MRTIRRLLWISLAVMALLSAPLRAQAEPTASSGSGWYGWQTIIVTGHSLAFIPLAFATRPEINLPLSLAGLTLGGPIVHFAHGNVGKGFASFGMNVGGAAVGFASGVGVACAGGCRGEFGLLAGYLGGALGAGIGVLTTNIIDATFLARGGSTSARYGMGARPRQALKLLPTVDIQPGRAAFGLAGSF